MAAREKAGERAGGRRSSRRATYAAIRAPRRWDVGNGHIGLETLFQNLLWLVFFGIFQEFSAVAFRGRQSVVLVRVL